jgi:N-acyl-D-amino-acid deacylase
MFDLVLRNGRVFTGAGNPWFRANIGVKNGKIVKIGSVGGSAKEIIDVRGQAVCPGFIDLHDHSDLTILVNREVDNKVHMGVSTTVFANCGLGVAPLSEKMRGDLLRESPFLKEAGVEVDWTTMEQYLARLESGGLSINVAPLVGFGSIREYVMGMDMRAPTKAELKAMKKEVDQAMKAGCRGISTGLRFEPQSYAATEEIVELSKVVAGYGGFYTSHIRDEGDRGDPLAALEEIIKIGREANIPVNISHFKVLSKRFWDLAPKLVEMVEGARAEGLQVTADQYPYSASGTGLQAWIPPWANEGGNEELVKRLSDHETTERIKAGLAVPMEDRGGPKNALISSYPLDPKMVGQNIAQVAKMWCMDPLDACVKLLRDHLEAILSGRVKGGFSIVNFNQKEENVELIMRQLWVAVGTDGRVHSPSGVLRKDIPAPHPRFYGTFPRILGRYTREREVLHLSEAVRKMTSLPAQILGLRDRGLIALESFADITVFDPEIVIDRADFAPAEATMRYPDGITYLMVNGVVTLRDGEHTGARAGVVLRKYRE